MAEFYRSPDVAEAPRGTTKENPIIPAAGQRLVSVLAEVLRSKDFQSTSPVYVETNGKQLMLTRNDSGAQIHVDESQGGQPISQAEADGSLQKALELNKRLEDLDLKYADLLAQYEEYKNERGRAYYEAHQ